MALSIGAIAWGSFGRSAKDDATIMATRKRALNIT
jgi:hypothetical protein